MKTQKIGALGERLAFRYLESRGYKILEQGYRSRDGEIDLIAWDQNKKMLVFVEVKARTQLSFGQPQEAVGFFKQRKLKRTAQAYLKNLHKDFDFRFDIIAILLDFTQNIAQVKHLQDALEGDF